MTAGGGRTSHAFTSISISKGFFRWRLAWRVTDVCESTQHECENFPNWWLKTIIVLRFAACEGEHPDGSSVASKGSQCNRISRSPVKIPVTPNLVAPAPALTSSVDYKSEQLLVFLPLFPSINKLVLQLVAEDGWHLKVLATVAAMGPTKLVLAVVAAVVVAVVAAIVAAVFQRHVVIDELANFDIILGQDLFHDFNPNVDFDNHVVHIEERFIHGREDSVTEYHAHLLKYLLHLI